jgi:hypothetical protein
MEYGKSSEEVGGCRERNCAKSAASIRYSPDVRDVRD